MNYIIFLNIMYLRSRRRRPVFSPLPEAQAYPDGVLALATTEARARVREEPLRRGPGAEGACLQIKPH